MQQLQQHEINAVSGGEFFGPLFNSLTGGMTDSERAVGITALSLGMVVGYYMGQMSWVLGVVGTAGYVGYDWYSGSADSEG